MLIRLSSDLGAYFYDVFVTRFDFWLGFGVIAQLLFVLRFVVQWIASERAGRSVMPLTFWFFSMGGGVLTLIYGIARRDGVIILGQALSIFIYARNLMLIFKEERERRRKGSTPVTPPFSGGPKIGPPRNDGSGAGAQPGEPGVEIGLQ